MLAEFHTFLMALLSIVFEWSALFSYELKPLDSVLVQRLSLLRVFCGFSKSLQANAGIAPQSRPWPFASSPFEFVVHILPFIQCYII